jgi:hypothetical protein
MRFTQAVIYLAFTFIGYIIGRSGHMIGGSLPALHHWIYGIALIVAGLFFERKKWGIPLLFFGLGLFISDANDFFHVRIYGADVVTEYKFWNID